MSIDITEQSDVVAHPVVAMELQAEAAGLQAALKAFHEDLVVAFRGARGLADHQYSQTAIEPPAGD